MWRLRTLASWILLAVLAILLATVLIGGLLDVWLTGRTLDRQYEERARAIAATVAQMPEVRDALLAGDPRHVIQPAAERVIAASGAAYVVVTDRTGTRYSHPNTALIGERLEEPVAVLDRQDHVGIDQGSLGRSANGKAPILDASGQVVGQVSVGILETQVAAQLRRGVEEIAAYSALALGVGAIVALLLARAIKRRTFGLELREIAALLQEREAMLHGIREGVIGLDGEFRVNLLNDEARRLLGLSSTGLGEHLEELLPPGRLRDVLSGRLEGADLSVVTSDAVLVVNRRPVDVGGRSAGSIVTLRDRTELTALMRRMDAVTGLSNALRAQEHEFTNRLHVIAGLLDLGEAEEARSYLDLIVEENVVPAEDLKARIGPPVLAALLLAKITVATERGVTLRVSPDSHLDLPDIEPNTLMTVVGNLVDNAVDAVADQPGPRTVTVHLSDDGGLVRVVVTDDGPGVPEALLHRIFTDGYSTKVARGGVRRGLGLALVQRLVRQAGGRVWATAGPGGHFEVMLPVGVPVGVTDR